jgi:hypothetical protein
MSDLHPTIISSYDGGKHNANLDETISRLEAEARYRDLSTIIIIPAFDTVSTRIVASWLNMFSPPNQKLVRLFAQGMEVGEAYSRTLETILNHPELSKFKYLLTLEHDNAPPCDGLVNILMRAEAHPEFAAIGGLYFTKGYGGVAQIWGDPNVHPINFRPQKPDAEGGLKECCGTGMGFTLFRLDTFKDEKLRKPWFKTSQSREEGVATQDLYFWNDARQHGYRCAIDCSIRVGHFDAKDSMMW